MRDILNQPEAESKNFLLVFDDGYECVHRHALPFLSEIGYRAVVFVPYGFIGSYNDWDHQLLGRNFRHLNREQLRDMISAGWQIGSHAISHVSLTQLSESQLVDELSRSRRLLEDEFGVAVEWISFPFSRYNDRILATAVKAGFVGAVVSAARRVTAEDGFMLWHADAVYLWDTPGSVAAYVSRSRGYPIGRAFRKAVNHASGGTILWKKLFPGRRNLKNLSRQK